MLVQREALAARAGSQAIRGALIDDCALARLMKRQGPIWLGLTERIGEPPRLSDDSTTSGGWWRARPTRSFASRRCASPARSLGMGLTYLAPPLLVIFADGLAQVLGAAAWALMGSRFLPILRLYGVSPLWALALPLIALVYTGFTIEFRRSSIGAGAAARGRAASRPARARAP